VTDALGRPIRLFLTAGNVSDYIGARALMSSSPKANWLLADRGYDADWFRNGLKDMKIKPCIPPRKSRRKIILCGRPELAIAFCELLIGCFHMSGLFVAAILLPLALMEIRERGP